MAKRSSVEDFIIDFSKEEKGGGGGVRYKPGTYLAKIVKAKPIVSENKGTPGLEMVIQFQEGKLAKKKMVETLYASPKAYSRFRTLLEACGKKVPKKVNLVRIARAVLGEELYIEIDDEEREGYKTRSRVTFEGFISIDDYDADEDEDDDEDDLDEDDDGLDLDDDEDDDLDDDEGGDDEEEEEPKPRRRRKKAPAKKTQRKAKDDEDEDDDLDDLDLDEL